MGLSNDLISQFVKATRDTQKKSKETTAYGTMVIASDGKEYVRLDGSEVLTPASSTTTVKNGDRVIVMIKNHTATVTGNLKDNAAMKSMVTNDDGEPIKLDVERLITDHAEIRGELEANTATVNDLSTRTLKVEEDLEAAQATIVKVSAEVLDVKIADIQYATIREALEASHATIIDLQSTYGEFEKLTTEKLEATDTVIKNLGVTYATIDFSNIGQAAMEYFYANSGLIENVVVENGTITGNLVGVTIKGDIIEANTVVADKLVIQGEDGLYYKLNTDGIATEAEQTEYNSLDGSVIRAKSVTATQISVSDLVAFDATIGGFNITENSIYSEVKDDEGNTTRGIYMDTDGQMNIGDDSNFIKYYKDEDGTYKLIISAASILYSLNGKQHSISDLGLIGEYVHIGTREVEIETLIGNIYDDSETVLTYLDSTDIGKKYKIVSPSYIDLSGGVDTPEGTAVYTEYAHLDLSGYSEVTITLLEIQRYPLYVLNNGYLGLKFIYELNGERQETTALFDRDNYPNGVQVTGDPRFDDVEVCGKALYICEMGTEPCIELGEKDSDFKLIITNTRILFTEGSSIPAHINNQSLHITKAVIEEEIQQGEFVWKVRANGNMGLMWKGGT